MIKLDIPEKVGKWIIAYRSISEVEYEFYLRDLGIDTILIKIERVENTQKFYGEIKFQISPSITASFGIPESISSNYNGTILKALKEFISIRIHQRKGILN